MISRACRIATLSAGIDLSLIGKGETLNRPADVLAAIPNPGRDNPVPVGGFIQEWWAASSRYGGRHNLGIVGGFVRNQHLNTLGDALLYEFTEDCSALINRYSNASNQLQFAT
jgi:hypothetical protein